MRAQDDKGREGRMTKGIRLTIMGAIRGLPIEKFPTSRGGGVGGGVGSGWGLGNFSSTFVLGTLEAGKHDVNNVNNVQCLITVSIGEILSPGEETGQLRQSQSTPIQMPGMPDTQ